MFFYLAIRMTFSLKTEANRIANTPNNNVTFAVTCHVITLVYRSKSIIKVVLMTIYNYCWFKTVQYNLFFHLKMITNH